MYKVVHESMFEQRNFVYIVKVNISIMDALFGWTHASSPLNHSKKQLYKCFSFNLKEDKR